MEDLRHIWDRIVIPLPLISASGSEGVLAHHGFGSFDIRRALYIEGRVVRLDWTDPHIGLKIEVLPGLRVPHDLYKVRVLPNNPLAIAVGDSVRRLGSGANGKHRKGASGRRFDQLGGGIRACSRRCERRPSRTGRLSASAGL